MSDMKLIMENWEKFSQEDAVNEEFVPHKWENEATRAFYKELAVGLKQLRGSMLDSDALTDHGENGALKDEVGKVYSTLKGLMNAAAQLAKY
tara:strand:+ start:881 stop:1156 length:276 start_codon:yes stop_codon:yes gene_type:complete